MFLYAQLEAANRITKRRINIWNTYHKAFSTLETKEKVCRPVIPAGCTHNAHMYYLLLPNLELRNLFISRLMEKGIHAIFHYVPLHDSPAGKIYCRNEGTLKVTRETGNRITRLPLWIGLEESVGLVIKEVVAAICELNG